MQYPKYIVFSIPNNSKRNPREGSRLKKEGMLAGVPDIMVPVPKGKFHGLFIEFKVGKNKLTESQANVIEYLRSKNYYCVVCYSFNDAIEEASKYLEQNDD